MKTGSMRLALAIGTLLVLAPGSAGAQDDGPEARLIASKASAVVSVQYILEITMEFGGQQREQERRGRTLGVVVGANGLVMVPAQAFEAQLTRRPGRRGGRRGGGGQANIEITSKPTNIRVVFPGDDKEYAAILGAKDSKTGLAFVLIDDLGSAKPAPVDMTKVAEPRVGQTLFGITRLSQGFDHAPICRRTRVTGKVSKPRLMWSINDGGQHVGKPLYTADGAVAGICATQKGGSGERNAAGRPFLLPLPAVQKVIARANTESEKSLAEIRKARAEESESEDAEESAEAEGDGADKPPAEESDDG